MSTGTALVHPDTVKLTPGEQKKGIYHYTPPEVLAFNNGERLSETDLEIVKRFYGGVIPNIAAHDVSHEVPAASAVAPRRVEASPALAAPYGGPKRLVSKRKVQPGGTPLVDITRMMVENLPEDDAWQILSVLAKRFDLEVE